ncbi:phage terminase large subunit family protein, partial [Raoultella planticola]|uniref:phage terminase large subunit family protein n=1 Tax=Raoultella planticola TaxID=575 RepID=UPI001D12F8BC
MQASPSARAVVGANGLSNSHAFMQWAGGHVVMASAFKPEDLRSRPARILLCDEIDEYKDGAQGSPIMLGIRRQDSFRTAKRMFA